MRARIGEAFGGELLLEGRAEEWATFALSVVPGHTIDLDTTGDPKPYSRFLSSVVTRGSDSKVRIVSEPDDILTISGSPANLSLLVKNMLAIAETPDPYHIHVDDYPDHPWLDEQSSPIVFAVSR